MKKKIGLFFGLLLGFCAIGGVCVGVNASHTTTNAIVACAEGEEQEIFECSVVLDKYEHGKISVDKEQGHIGDIVTITAKHDLCYLVESVSVNGTSLVEDEEISGKYFFALVEGENKISAKFVIDKELLGEMSTIVEQASNKDWTNLFSVENVVRIVTFLLNGGLLLAMVRYFIKDKRIAKNVETSVKESMAKVVPETTKQVIIENTKEVIEPIFVKTSAYQEEIIRVLAVLIKCIALMQEDTPDAKRAVLSELANLNVGDRKVIDDAKSFLEQYFADKMNELNSVLAGLDTIIDRNKEIADKTVQIAQNEAVEEEPSREDTVEPTPVVEDGTQF